MLPKASIFLWFFECVIIGLIVGDMYAGGETVIKMSAGEAERCKW